LGKVVSCKRGRNITVVCAINESGNYVPPMFIYFRERISDLLKKDGDLLAQFMNALRKDGSMKNFS